MSALGYLPYLAYVFLPGLGASELFHIWKDDDGFTARVAYAFGVGLCIDTVIMTVRTAGVTNLLTGLDTLTVYGTVALGLGMLAASVVVRRRFSWWRRPTRLDLGFLAVMLVQALIVILYFQKYPIFPEYLSQDFAVHVHNTQALIAGTYVTITHGILYNGIYFQLSPALLLVGGTPLVTVRWTMALLTVLSPLLFYLATQRLTANQSAGVIAALLYALSGPIWFGGVFDSGLFSNFFGMLAALFLIIAFLDAGLGQGARGAIVALALATPTAYFSHYSVVTVLPAILFFPIVNLFFKDKAGARPFVAAGIVILPGLAGVIAYPHEIVRLLAENATVASITGATALSNLLSFYPVLSYMALEVNYDLGFAILIALACVYIWKFGSTRSAVFAIPIIWLATLLVASPFSSSAWRFSFEALVPLTLMAGLGLFSLLPKFEKSRRRLWRGTSSFPWKAGLVVVLVLVPVVADSWGAQAVSDSLTDTSLVAQGQSLVNQSIVWLGANTPQNATYLSVSDWRFTYTSLLIGRKTTYQFTSKPNTAMQIARGVNATYIIVTNHVTENLPPVPALFPWNNFPPSVADSNLTLVYQNSDVRIYHIV